MGSRKPDSLPYTILSTPKEPPSNQSHASAINFLWLSILLQLMCETLLSLLKRRAE